MHRPALLHTEIDLAYHPVVLLLRYQNIQPLESGIILYAVMIFSRIVSNAFLKLIKVITAGSLCSFTSSTSLLKANVWLTVALPGLNLFWFIHICWPSLVFMQFRIISLRTFETGDLRLILQYFYLDSEHDFMGLEWCIGLTTAQACLDPWGSGYRSWGQCHQSSIFWELLEGYSPPHIFPLHTKRH